MNEYEKIKDELRAEFEKSSETIYQYFLENKLVKMLIPKAEVVQEPQEEETKEGE